MSMHCDQCDQGRRCTGACMEHYDDDQRTPIGIRGALLWAVVVALGVALAYLIFGG